MRATIGMPKARVLPEPVGARGDVAAAAGVGKAQGLDGKGVVDAACGERRDEVGGRAEIGEGRVHEEMSSESDGAGMRPANWSHRGQQRFPETRLRLVRSPTP